MTPEQIEQSLRDAMANRRVVCLTYSGKARNVAPHALFYSAGGQLLLHGWEVADAPDEQAEATLAGAKNFDMRHVAEVRASAVRFTPDPAFDPAARRFRYGLVCSVA